MFLNIQLEQGGYAQGGRIKYAIGDSASDNAMQAAGIEGYL